MACDYMLADVVNINGTQDVVQLCCLVHGMICFQEATPALQGYKHW